MKHLNPELERLEQRIAPTVPLPVWPTDILTCGQVWCAGGGGAENSGGSSGSSGGDSGGSGDSSGTSNGDSGGSSGSNDNNSS